MAPSCVICYERDRGTLIYPCGHSNLCAHCLERLPTQHCPTCRKPIRSISLTPFHSSFQRNIHLLGLPASSPQTPTPLPQNRHRSILFISPPSVPLQHLFYHLSQSYPTTSSQQGVTEIMMCGRRIRLVSYHDNGTETGTLFDTIRHVRPKLLIMCCHKNKMGTFEKMVRSDLGLLQRTNRENRMPARLWVILDEGKIRRASHGVERSDLQAAWHYTGVPRMVVDVDMSAGKAGVRRLGLIVGMMLGVNRQRGVGRIAAGESQGLQFKETLKSLLCLRNE